MDEPIWQGVYASFDEAPLQSGYECDAGMLRVQEKLLAARKAYSDGTLLYQRNAAFPQLVATLAGLQGKVSALDFGGGAGITFLETAAALPDLEKIDFHIVELPMICRLGQNMLSDFDCLVFHHDLPASGHFDVVHFGSSLHYVEDWVGLLETLLVYNPNYMMFTDLPAGDNPAYCTVQRYYDARLPVHFFNRQTFIDTVEKMGFLRVFESRYQGKILGKEQPLPQENFEPQYRVGDTRTMLFQQREQE